MAMIVFENGEPRTEPVMLRSDVVVPPGIETLADFRCWALSDEFPETGRIDYLNGRIEVDISPEDLFTHGTLKSQLLSKLQYRADELQSGFVTSDSTRVSNDSAGLSAVPDVVFIAFDSIQSDAVRMVPKTSGEEGRYVEVEGGPDLVVEIVSDSSVHKDTVDLRQAYSAAGVIEYWIADAHGPQLHFEINVRGDGEFVSTTTDKNGVQFSSVMQCGYRLQRTTHPAIHWLYHLEELPK